MDQQIPGILVEKQQRLIRAETAEMEISRRTDRDHIRSQVESALGIRFPDKIKDEYLKPSVDDGPDDQEYCLRGVVEYLRHQHTIDSGDLARLKTEDSDVVPDTGMGCWGGSGDG